MIQFDLWMPISPVRCSASDSFTITDDLPKGTSITALSVKIYLGSTDKTATNITGAGTSTVGSNVYTTGVIHALLGGKTYVLAATVTIDGITTTRKCEIRVSKDSDLP